MKLLLLLVCLQVSLQQNPPPGRCDIQQREDVNSLCTSCAAMASIHCPPGFSRVKGRLSNCTYVVQIGGKERPLQGCMQHCIKSYMYPMCCPGHWGPLCLPCPSWAGKTCNLRGTCRYGDVNNGTCECEDNFSGVSCHECKDPKKYGENCDKECDCVHGVCNKGPEGDGQCLCQPPYTGRRCDQVSTRCTSCTSYSYCKGEGDAAYCECLPGYRKSLKNTCTAVCSQRDCDVNAQCSAQGSKVTCTCKPDYEGDGKVCVPRNPCAQNNGGCPTNSTVCVFNGPNKSLCRCMFGMSPVSADSRLGCRLVSACFSDTCHPTATCQTGVDGQHRCVCGADEIGDGYRCYGNLMERLLELDRSGDQRDNLTGAVALFENGCGTLLRHNGPFTVFVPLLKTLPPDLNQEVVCKNHLILGQHLYKDLAGQDFNMYGGARLRTKEHKRFLLMENPSRLYSVLQDDLPASNGIVHLVDQLLTDQLLTDPAPPPRDLQFADKTIGEIVSTDGRFNRFLSLVDNCGSPPPLRSPGTFTVFVPSNQAVDRARDGSILYMLRDAKHKLQELLRHHVFSQAALTVDQLAALPHIQTMANQKVEVTVSENGALLLGDKSVRLLTSDIMASNGVIHVIDGLLFPPSILPILPHRCDSTHSKITLGPCVHCNYLSEAECPEGSVEMDRHQVGCDYTVSAFKTIFSNGCAKYCNTTRTTAECCPGFYGPDCKPCIGGFQNPCYNKGKCFDGIHGNGSCSCQPGLTGVACHLCIDPDRHGENCDEECHCVHGVCDNRPGSGGLCRRGSCLDGFSGPKCDRTSVPCSADGRMEHCHVHAYCTHSGLNNVCACRDGFEGDGHSCSPVNLCLRSSRGGCDANAECSYAGPGNVSCVCVNGWTGDGRVCVEINNCQLETRGGCGFNADCKHIGPGQSECVCRKGFMGDGILCDFIDPCLTNNGGCHRMAKCSPRPGDTHTCTCPEGYGGDGHSCYGSLLDELDTNPRLYMFNLMAQEAAESLLQDLSGNVTLLAPSFQAMRNMSQEEHQFWSNRYRLPPFLRAHILQGIYSREDLDKLVGQSLPTLHPPTRWGVSNTSGMILIGGASIVTRDLPATNGFIHIMNQVLMPRRSDLPPEPPSLMSFLNTSSNFTLFRQYVQRYNLSQYLDRSTVTLLLPTDEAVRQHLSGTPSSVLDADVLKYHVIPNVLLFPDHLSDGTLSGTLLGATYQLQFRVDHNNQTFANDVLLDGSFIEGHNGVAMVLNQVLKVRRNRCDKPITLQRRGRCSACEGKPGCSNRYKPVRDQFPVNMKSNCKYRSRSGGRGKTVPGCVINCVHTTTDHSCCPGYYGHECFRCPGAEGSWCSGHGQCLDGSLGNGECRCYEGFHGTACEDCEPGRYGVNCSSKCVCSHGKCDDGLAGSGKCLCYKGWKGATCSIEIKDDACGGACDENANCITAPNGQAAVCVCAAGYQGNGTHCSELDLCSRSNGGCSEFAQCRKVSAGERTCSCKAGFTGDGVVCLEIDGCLVNNGGCSQKQECLRAGPNITSCRCRQGFRRRGRDCERLNPCRTNNGGCSRYASCSPYGDGDRNCTCKRGHVGDGLVCRGSVDNEIQQNSNYSFIRSMLAMEGPGLYNKGPYTVFSPAGGVNDTVIEAWKKSGRSVDLAYYHVVSCEVLTFSDLKATKRAVAMSGHTLHFSMKEGSLWINNVSRVVESDYTVVNGVIHQVEQLLTPYQLEDQLQLQPNLMNLTTAISFYGYTRFSRLLEDSGVVPLLDMSLHQPYTIFWPSNQALDAMAPERWRWLTSPDNQQQLAAIVKAHVVRNIKLLSLSRSTNLSSFRSMHGSSLKFSCDKNLVGDILINGDAARLQQRHMSFKVGVAYGIDHLLEPPGLGAHCDDFQNKTTYGRCGRCSLPPTCSFRYIDTGETMVCVQPGRRYSVYSSHFSRAGCKRICTYKAWTQKCCKNHYGRDCQVCPGGVEAPCGSRGSCSDGVSGLGHCRCDDGFRGTSCQLCDQNHYGPNCTACSCTRNGKCDDGREGSGSCTCSSGWGGERCQNKLDSLPEECRGCHADAECHEEDGCLCKPGFKGDGTTCSPEPPPDLCSQYNGGCHPDANCSQTGGVVSCACGRGHQGDGYECRPINRCVEEANGGCSDFASCSFTGPNQRSCECLAGFVGNGVQCLEKVENPVDRCLEDNGGCDPVATCRDLHYHANTAGVFHLRSAEGKYQLNFSRAAAACRAEGATLASFKQLGDAQQLGMHRCAAGWLGGGRVGYPTRYPSLKCGENHVGLVMYKEPVDRGSQYDAYCYRLKDVECSCPAEYVGDGDFCHGVLSSVLATYNNFSIFYKFLLDYSSSSTAGQQLVDILSHRRSNITVFVPHNAGFAQNQTLSARDLEYHVSTNHSSRLYSDLKPQDAIASRLGFNLTVTAAGSESGKLVNQRLLVEWDIPAVNGIVHVIEAPLSAPPPPVFHSASRGHAHSSGAALTAVLTVLLACVLAAGGYFLLKHRNDNFRFRYFKNEDENGSPGGRNKPTLVCIPNPLYVASRDLNEPFGEPSQQGAEGAEPAERDEPPSLLDVDQ